MTEPNLNKTMEIPQQIEVQNAPHTPSASSGIDYAVWLDEPLPKWAIGKLDGEYMTAGAGLATRDGRRMGNAFVYQLTEHKEMGMLATVITDMGNEFKMTESELREAFHPPAWLMSVEEAKACRIQSNAQDQA